MNFGQEIREADDVEKGLSSRRAMMPCAASALDLRWHPCQRPTIARRTLFPPSNTSLSATKTVAPSAKIRSDRVPSMAPVKADKVLPHDGSAFLWMCG